MQPQVENLLRLVAEIIGGAIARNRHEKELRQNQEFYWSILENLSEAVLLTSLEGDVVYSNRAWVQIVGAGESSDHVSPLIDMVHFDDVQKERLAQQQVIKQRSMEAYPLRLVVDRRGTTRWYLVTKRVLRLPVLNGEEGLLITLLDDTERREWEEKLLAAKVRAESASEAKTLYLSKASHELRPPLHGVLSMLELLQNTELSEQQRRFAGSAEIARPGTYMLLISGTVRGNQLEGLADMPFQVTANFIVNGGCD